MEKSDLPPSLLPSLKDRLLDPDCMGTADRPGYSLEQLVASVRADLEELLNTRRSAAILKSRFRELAKSVASYGLPDLASMDTTTPGKREELGRVIEEIITLHEPRLRKVKATMQKTLSVELSVTFQIDAELRVDPAPPVFFETQVELTTGHVAVREGQQ